MSKYLNKPLPISTEILTYGGLEGGIPPLRVKLFKSLKGGMMMASQKNILKRLFDFAVQNIC